MSSNNLLLLNRFFSRSTFRHLIDRENDKTYTSVIRRYIDLDINKSNAELISEIYCKLENNYRNEYFYKNTLLNKLLLGVHSVNTTTALTEMPIAKSKADFVLINGKAVVYEIKTELDNFDRLNSQIDDYYKAFDYVAVVTCLEQVKALEKKIELLRKPVGIYVLKQNGCLSTIKKPEKYDKEIDPEIVFKILRKVEYENIILEAFGSLPEVSQFQYYSACKDLFLKINSEKMYDTFLKELKKRNHIVTELFQKTPYELKFLSYFMDLKENEYLKLNNFLDKQYGGV